MVWSSGGHAHADGAVAARRIAVVVGANAAPAGRRELRYAANDAQRVVDSLERVGRFAHDDVHMLIDPSPTALLQQLDDVATRVATGGDTLMVFYYSGHSDGQALYPNGELLRLADVREHLLRIQARVRVGILDTCRGGSWTQAKDLHVGPPLAAADVAALASEGTVLVAASSGFESAHEAQALNGSFFTHHLTAGLLGAADRSNDGDITLQEAFEYARERTVRDSLRYAPVPQHPSFEIDLRGRQDVVLTQVAASPSVLELEPTQGPLEIINLASADTVAELPTNKSPSRLALKPGRYLIRRVTTDGIYSRELDIPTRGQIAFNDKQLQRGDDTALAQKGGDVPRAPLSQASSQQAGWWEWRVAAGVATGPWTLTSGAVNSFSIGNDDSPDLSRSFTFRHYLGYAITDRLTWSLPLPAFSYRFGEPGETEVVVNLGLASLGYHSQLGVTLYPDAGATLRWWTSRASSLLVSASLAFSLMLPTAHDLPSGALASWNFGGALGYGLTLNNSVSLYPGVMWQRTIGISTGSGTWDPARWDTLGFGSVLTIGYRWLPLVQVHLSPSFSIDGHASWSTSLAIHEWYDSYMAGFTWDF